MPSCPDKSCQVGSLVTLLPFAAEHHATILEIYCSDWLIAYNQNFPGNAQYGAAYATAIEDAARGK
jgi:hypothetical protein